MDPVVQSWFLFGENIFVFQVDDLGRAPPDPTRFSGPKAEARLDPFFFRASVFERPDPPVVFSWKVGRPDPPCRCP
jgi:hypothetical protein